MIFLIHFHQNHTPLNKINIEKHLPSMDSTSKPFSLVSHILVLLASLGLLLPPCVKCSSDFSTLVYKKCSNQTYTGSTESHSQTLSSLFQELLPQSSNSKFFKTTAGDENIGISAFFQCRNDLSNDECYNCVNTLPKVSNSLCKQALAARVHLDGCYFKYETDGLVEETSTHELLHETCSEKKVVGSGFEEVKYAAFAAMESGVVSDGGFYETNYEYLHVMAECQGDLGGCDCGECISIAVQVAEEKCGSSISSQVYLDKCFMSYTYYPDGIPGNSYPEKKSNFGNSTGKKVAIVLGGAAVLGVGFILLKVFKSCGKKDDI